MASFKNFLLTGIAASAMFLSTKTVNAQTGTPAPVKAKTGIDYTSFKKDKDYQKTARKEFEAQGGDTAAMINFYGRERAAAMSHAGFLFKTELIGDGTSPLIRRYTAELRPKLIGKDKKAARISMVTEIQDSNTLEGRDGIWDENSPIKTTYQIGKWTFNARNPDLDQVDFTVAKNGLDEIDEITTKFTNKEVAGEPSSLKLIHAGAQRMLLQDGQRIANSEYNTDGKFQQKEGSMEDAFHKLVRQLADNKDFDAVGNGWLSYFQQPVSEEAAPAPFVVNKQPEIKLSSNVKVKKTTPNNLGAAPKPGMKTKEDVVVDVNHFKNDPDNSYHSQLASVLLTNEEKAALQKAGMTTTLTMDADDNGNVKIGLSASKDNSDVGLFAKYSAKDGGAASPKNRTLVTFVEQNGLTATIAQQNMRINDPKTNAVSDTVSDDGSVNFNATKALLEQKFLDNFGNTSPATGNDLKIQRVKPGVRK